MKDYCKTDQILHQWSQTIAKFNRSFAKCQTDDSHTNLAFDPIRSALLGRWADTSTGRIILVFDLTEFKFSIYNHNWESIFSYIINGKTQKELEQSIAIQLEQMGLDSNGFTKKLHYEIPKYEFTNKPFVNLNSKSIIEWSNKRSLANDACYWFLNHLQVHTDIRIWPHHFDTGVYIEPNEKLGLGFGLAMQDKLINSPYYYFTAYGLKNIKIKFQYSKNLTYGQWIIKENFKGAVLNLKKVNKAALRHFIKEVAHYYLNLNC